MVTDSRGRLVEILLVEDNPALRDMVLGAMREAMQKNRRREWFDLNWFEERIEALPSVTDTYGFARQTVASLVQKGFLLRHLTKQKYRLRDR